MTWFIDKGMTFSWDTSWSNTYEPSHRNWIGQ